MSRLLREMQRRMPKNSMPSGNVPDGAKGLVLALGGGALALATVYKSMFQVDAGHAAVVFSKFGGVKDRVYMPGTQFCIPWVESPVVFNTQTQDRKIRARTGNRDLQQVDMQLTVLCRPVPEALPEIYRTMGRKYEELVLPSIVNEVLKSVAAQYTANQLITQRMQVSQQIERNLKEAAKPFHMIVDNVALTHATFGSNYTSAIEAKQIALQQAEQAKYLVKQAEQDKFSTIIKAEGEAKSAKLIGEAISRDPGYIQLRQLEYAASIAETLQKHKSNKVYLDADTLLLNVLKEGDMQARLDAQGKNKR